jgi:hypothetical protein
MEQEPRPPMITWLDPGLTTGYAYFTDTGSFHSGELDFFALGSQLEMSCDIHGSGMWLGWEHFTINQSTASKLGSEWALQVIGVAKYLATKYDCEILPSRSPSSRELGGLQKLRRLDWYKSGKGHANDAASHLLSYLITDHFLPSDLLAKAMMPDNYLHVAG